MASQIEHDHEVHELAKLLIARRGERAVTYARYQALKAGRLGHERMMRAWHLVADTAEQVWRVEPT
jgi:hypothetical protein